MSAGRTQAVVLLGGHVPRGQRRVAEREPGRVGLLRDLGGAVVADVRGEGSSTTYRSSCSFPTRPSLTSSSSSTMAWAARGATTRDLGAMEISSLLLLVLHRGADLGDDIGAEPLGHGEQPVGDLARALDDERLRTEQLAA
jgi:hypothetical protein